MEEKEFGWLYTNENHPDLVKQLEETGLQVIVKEAIIGECLDPTLRISGSNTVYAGVRNIFKHYITKQKPLKTTN